MQRSASGAAQAQRERLRQGHLGRHRVSGARHRIRAPVLEPAQVLERAAHHQRHAQDHRGAHAVLRLQAPDMREPVVVQHPVAPARLRAAAQASARRRQQAVSFIVFAELSGQDPLVVVQ